MAKPFAQANSLQEPHRLITDLLLAAQFERHHHVLHRGKRRDKLKVLEDEPDGFIAHPPPSARSVTPCAEGLALRLSERRNCWNPATLLSASSIRPEALDDSRSAVSTCVS